MLQAEGHRAKGWEDMRTENLLGMVLEVGREPKPMHPCPDWFLRQLPKVNHPQNPGPGFDLEETRWLPPKEKPGANRHLCNVWETSP